MDIRSFIESKIFKYRKIPTLDSLVNADEPDCDEYYFIDASNITIGNLEWKGPDWTKVYRHGEDPMFRDSLPWDQQGSSSDNITLVDNEIVLTKPKEQNSKDAYLCSNFRIKYGTVRALIKTPNVKGIWSAFWLFGETGAPEHDIFEHCGGWKNEVAVTHHWGYDYENVRGKKSTLWNGRKNKNFYPTEDYYLYEVELTPYKTIYRINGMTVRTVRRGLSSGDNVVLLDVTKGQYCGVDPSVATDGDGIMKVKYLEIFKIK